MPKRRITSYYRVLKRRRYVPRKKYKFRRYWKPYRRFGRYRRNFYKRRYKKAGVALSRRLGHDYMRSYFRGDVADQFVLAANKTEAGVFYCNTTVLIGAASTKEVFRNQLIDYEQFRITEVTWHFWVEFYV